MWQAVAKKMADEGYAQGGGGLIYQPNIPAGRDGASIIAEIKASSSNNTSPQALGQNTSSEEATSTQGPARNSVLSSPTVTPSSSSTVNAPVVDILREAACAGDKDTVEKTLKEVIGSGGDAHQAVNDKHKMNGWTPLHWAAKRDHSGVVKSLLAYGADPNIKNNAGQTPGDIAGATTSNLLGNSKSTILPTHTGEKNSSKTSFTPSYLKHPSTFYDRPSAEDLERKHKEEHMAAKVQELSSRKTALPLVSQDKLQTVSSSCNKMECDSIEDLHVRICFENKSIGFRGFPPELPLKDLMAAIPTPQGWAKEQARFYVDAQHTTEVLLGFPCPRDIAKESGLRNPLVLYLGKAI
eukprot:UC4_evm1s1119